MRPTPEGNASVPSAEHSVVTVASYNVHRFIGVDRQCRPERTLEVIRGVAADIIGLQEVSSPCSAGSSVSLEHLAACAGLTAVAGPTITLQSGTYGNLLLTRFPVEELQLVDLTVGSREPRGAIDARLRVGDRTLRVMVTHLGLSWRERRAQLAKLIAAARSDSPLVLLGDLNEWRPLATRLLGSGQGVGGGRSPATFPSWFPLLALDRILVRPAALLTRLEVVRSQLTRQASDHLPVRAELDWARAERAGRT